jgi:hypothetical protein
MSKINQIFLFTLFAGLFFTACFKDNFTTTATRVEVTFAGRVIDEEGRAIPSAKVRAGGEVATTDENGVFRLKNLRLPENDAKLYVTKIGYFDFSRAYYVNDRSFQNLNIQLMRKEQTASFNATSGAVIEVPGGAKLRFPANAIATESGQSYSGGVRVFARYLDPADPNLGQYMPGDLRGIDAGGEERILATYGMISVELEGNGGQPLNISEGQQVEIRMPVSPRQAAQAPASMPLWHYDMEQARWVEEGVIQKAGNEYVGTVSHFSFWNADVPFNLIELTGKVYLGDEQHPFAGAKVRLTAIPDSTSAFATTNALGCFKGGVPSGVSFVMEILDACGSVIFTQNIGPFDMDHMLPSVILPNGGSNQINISGTLVDCSGAPVTNGYVKIQLDNLHLTAFTDSSGSFSVLDFRCDTSTVEAHFIAFDMTSLLQSQDSTFSVPPDSVSLGSIAVCDTLNEYIIYTLDNEDFVRVDPSAIVLDSSGLQVTFIHAVNAQSGITLSFNNAGQTGTFPILNFWAAQVNVAQPPVGLTTTVTTVALNVGDVLEGEFGGSFLDVFGITHQVSGTYRVIRE